MECDNICNELEIYNYKLKQCEPKDEYIIDGWIAVLKMEYDL